MTSEEYAATEAKFNMSLVEDLRGAISIASPSPTSKGPTTLAALKLFIILNDSSSFD